MNTKLSKAAKLLYDIARGRFDVVGICEELKKDKRNPDGEVVSIVSLALQLDYVDPNHGCQSEFGPFTPMFGPNDRPSEVKLDAWEELAQLFVRHRHVRSDIGRAVAGLKRRITGLDRKIADLIASSP